MERFDCFAPDALRFLAELKANNSRDWFAQNRAAYDTFVKAPAKGFAAEMTHALGALTGREHDSKIFRINRDIRFSKDKTPYNAHIHMAFTPRGLTGTPPMWFFGVSPEALSLGCGVFQYDKAGLTAFRTAMAGPQGAELLALSQRLRDAGVRIGEPALKRVPPGFDKDHPHAEALRRKGFSAWIDRDDPGSVTVPGVVARVVEDLAPLLPVYRLLSTLG